MHLFLFLSRDFHFSTYPFDGNSTKSRVQPISLTVCAWHYFTWQYVRDSQENQECVGEECLLDKFRCKLTERARPFFQSFPPPTLFSRFIFLWFFLLRQDFGPRDIIRSFQFAKTFVMHQLLLLNCKLIVNDKNKFLRHLKIFRPRE